MICPRPECNGKHKGRWPKAQLCPAAVERRQASREAYEQRPGSKMRSVRYNATAGGWERRRRSELRNERAAILAKLAQLKEQEESCRI